MADDEPVEELQKNEEDEVHLREEEEPEVEGEDVENEEKKEAPKERPKFYFDEIYGEEFGGEGMDLYPPPSDLDLLMGSETKLVPSASAAEVEERLGEIEKPDLEKEKEASEDGEEQEEGEKEEEGEAVEEVTVLVEEKSEPASEKTSLTTMSSFEYGMRVNEYFMKPKEKTPSEIQFETDYREVVEERMKRIMQPPIEDEKRAEERTPVQKKKLVITDFDVSGLYPPPKVIESEVSFAFDEEEEVEKGVSGTQKEADITQYIMDVVRDSLKYDPESIFTKNTKEAIQKVRALVEEIVTTIRKGKVVDIPQRVNQELLQFKPNLRNTLIIRLKEKLDKSESALEAEEEEEGKPPEAEKVKQKIKRKHKLKTHKKAEKIHEEVEEEKLEVVRRDSAEEKPVKLTSKVTEDTEKWREEREEEKLDEERETVIPYEKIDWLQYLTESERQLAIDQRLRSEMELYISTRKADLEKNAKTLAEKKEKKYRYSKVTDPQEKLKTLNLNVTMKFVLNTGDIFTCAYRYFLTFKEIKEDLSGIFKVPSDVLIIYRDEVEVKDNETAFDLRPEVEPFDCVTFRLLTLDNDRWVLRSDHLDLPVPDIITCTVETGKDHLGVAEYKDVVVEIENRQIKKPFIGGYRDCATGVEYHHAFSQSAPHPPKLPWEKRVSRDTQTAFTKVKHVDTTINKSTQMWRRDYYVSTESDKILTAQPYVDYDTWYKERDVEGKVKTIQRYVRAMILRKFMKKMSHEYHTRFCWEIEQEKKRILERENRIKAGIINMTYPKTKADFDILYSLVEKWRKAQLERIINLKTEAPKKAELCTVLEKEIKLLEAIEVHRVAITKRHKRMRMLNFMKRVARPVTWTGYKGMTIKMDTLKTQRARELKELYQSLSRHELNYQDRIELLVSLKHALRVHPTRVAEELTNLIDQECEMLIRGVKPKDLEYLRQRIEHLFGEFFKDPHFNPEVAKHDPSFNKEPFRNILFCKMCHQMKLIEHFYGTTRDRSVNVCSTCQWIYNIAIPRVDLNPYRYILKTVRRDEQKRNCYSSCAFVLQDEDMRFLVANIWRNRSAVSENDNLLDLRMPRWDPTQDWTPWNCILLTELETKAHLKTSPDNNYEPQLIGEIVSKHEMAKRRFQQLLSTATRLRDSGEWANAVDVKDYPGLGVTADIPDLEPEECMRLKKGAFYEVHEWPMGNDTMKSKMEIDPTTQKDAGYYECQADNQYAIDRRGFRTDYVIYTY